MGGRRWEVWLSGTGSRGTAASPSCQLAAHRQDTLPTLQTCLEAFIDPPQHHLTCEQNVLIGRILFW